MLHIPTSVRRCMYYLGNIDFEIVGKVIINVTFPSLEILEFCRDNDAEVIVIAYAILKR